MKTLVMLAITLSMPAPFDAVQSQELAAGIRQVQEGDLEAAVVTLDALIRGLSGVKGREQELATAHLYLAMAHLGLSQLERAKASVRQAWRSDRAVTVDPQKFPPTILQYFEEAKREELASPSPTTTAGEAASRAPANPAPPPRKGGGSKAVILIAAGAVAAGGVALAARSDAAPTPTPTPTPTTGSVAIRNSAPFEVTLQVVSPFLRVVIQGGGTATLTIPFAGGVVQLFSCGWAASETTPGQPSGCRLIDYAVAPGESWSVVLSDPFPRIVLVRL